MVTPVGHTDATVPFLALSSTKIETAFRGSPQRIFSSSEIGRFIDQNKDAWLVTGTQANGKSTIKRKGQLIPLNSDGQTAILNALLEHTKLQRVRMPFPYRTDTRFTWDEAPTFELIQSLDANGYFSHYTAMHLHGLTDQIPKTIYFNVEQPASAGGGKLSQEGIDRAFRGKCRTSNNVITFGDMRICRLNGGNTHQLGVVDFKTDEGEKIRITDTERTLIDAVVRPVYAGGIGEVAEAFRAATDKVSIKKLAEYLRRLNFTYPYHQAIGFYLEHAGTYKGADIKLMQRFPIEYDFYLNYQLKNPAHNKKWRLFTPQRF
jgi:predicted transcriptional regulator of viral defense system